MDESWHAAGDPMWEKKHDRLDEKVGAGHLEKLISRKLELGMSFHDRHPFLHAYLDHLGNQHDGEPQLCLVLYLPTYPYRLARVLCIHCS